MQKVDKWQLQSSLVPDSIEQVLETLLHNRQIEDEQSFWQPPSPLDLSLVEAGFIELDLAKLLARLAAAKAKQEQILIFGDYDADGICATAILWQSLHSLGYRATPFIPNRARHGYGLSVKALTEVLEQQPEVSLLISVDNGIVAHKALDFLADRQIEVIVTDHHQPDGRAPRAHAVFHSTRICGAAVAWFLARELGTEADLLHELMALMAIATITDLMPLTGVNRSIVSHGLLALRQSQQVGLQELLAVAGIKQTEIDTYHLGFQLGPRLNAMGRLADSMNALRLLCTQQAPTAKRLSQLLQSTNQDRQELTENLFKQAETLAQSLADEPLIIIDSPDFHEGIIGLLAGRLVEKFAKPSIVLNSSQDIAKASARSLGGFHITDFIREFGSDLLEFGGHPLAAGFAMETSKLAQLKSKMQTRARELLGAQPLVQAVSVDLQLPASLIGLELITALQSLAPFGLANPQPLFLVEGLTLLDFKLMGKDGAHLKMQLQASDSEPMEVVAWRRGDLATKLQAGARYDLLAQLEVNEWRGRQRVQLVMRDVRPHHSK